MNREDFSILKDIIYLDNAATSLTPPCVIEAMNKYYMEYRANIHRGIHRLSEQAIRAYEKSHADIARSFGADSEEIVITKNTTEAINQIAFSLLLSGRLKRGDKVVTTLIEHHSNFLPWLRLSKKYGITLDIIRPNKKGIFDISDFENAAKDASLITITHASNVLGCITPVKEICKIAHKNGALMLVDGAQSAPHMEINVKWIDCDFFTFSGHKMCGPTGVGGFYIRKRLAEELEPAFLGGGTITKASSQSYSLGRLPDRWEAGTPDIAGVIGLGEAVRYLKTIGMKKIEKYEKELTIYALEKLSAVPYIEIYGPDDEDQRLGVISFNLGRLPAHDVAAMLDRMAKIAVRSGHHCAMPLHEELLKKPATCRASLYFYNNKEDIDALVKALREIAKII